MCKSDEEYQPLGTNPWIGESQSYIDNPEYRPSAGNAPPGQEATAPAAATPSVGTASYDPDTGGYVGSDGQVYTQQDLAGNPHHVTKEPSSWQTMLNPAV
jgi:phospholipid/cholesterol/gamma-HCH transport system substrate-binding protein